MLFARFRSGSRNDPGPLSQVDFLPGRQPHFLGARGSEHLKLKAADRRRRGPTVGSCQWPGDLVMRDHLLGLLERRRVGEGLSDAVRRVIGPEALRLRPFERAAHPVFDPLRGFRFGRPNGIENRQHVRRRDLGDRPLADDREDIMLQGRPPELRGFAAMFPRGLV